MTTTKTKENPAKLDEPKTSEPVQIEGGHVHSHSAKSSSRSTSSTGRKRSGGVREVNPSKPGGGPVESPKFKATPVHVDNRTKRSDDDALEGHFCRIVKGEHDGLLGTFEFVEAYDPSTGYPKTIVFRSRDSQAELHSVPYADVRPTPEYRGGR